MPPWTASRARAKLRLAYMCGLLWLKTGKCTWGCFNSCCYISVRALLWSSLALYCASGAAGELLASVVSGTITYIGLFA